MNEMVIVSCKPDGRKEETKLQVAMTKASISRPVPLERRIPYLKLKASKK